MKKFFFLFLFLANLTALAQTDAEFPAPSNPPRLVNDFAGLLQPAEREALERKLVALDDSTSNQISVVIIRSLGGYDRADYATQLANRWGIGGRQRNNGLLFLIATEDRKYFIATGYGLEGALPDATVKGIEEDFVRPNFQAGNYYQGIEEATTALAQAAAGEYRQPRQRSRKGSSNPLVGIIVLFFVFFIISRFFRRGGRGGGLGGGSLFPPFILLGGGGSYGGGGFGGGGFGGSGGGFGGFGGGSFGGGGAGGDW